MIHRANRHRHTGHLPKAEHETSDSSVYVIEIIVTNCSPDTANFDLKTTFMRNRAPGKSYICINKSTQL